MYSVVKSFRLSLILSVLFLGLSVGLKGQTPITTINTNAVTTGLTTSNYTATSPSDASGSISPSTSYLVKYGQTQNLLATSYVAGGVTYDNFVLPDTLIIQRTDGGRQLIIFYEYTNVDTGPNPDEINIDAEQVDNEDALYQSGYLNAGYDNILVNDATNFANVERIDIIYYQGVVTATPANAVFPIVERGGNDDILVAAISALDSEGNPSAYFPTVVAVDNNGTDEWEPAGGPNGTGIDHESLVLRRQDATSNPLPQTTLGTQQIHGCAIAFDEFGVAANEIVYGYSIMAADVDITPVSNIVDFSNTTNFPTNTGSASGLDLIAGISTAVASDENLTRVAGPGGYKPALDTWLKANAGVTTSTDGSTVTDWQDQWLGDHDATTLTSAPTYRDGIASGADDINFNPTVDFLDAAERGLQIANNTDFNTATSYETKGINIAIRTGNDITTKQQIYEQGSEDRGINVYIRAGSLYIGAWNIPSTDGTGDNWGFSSTSTSSIATETEYIITLEFNGNSSGSGTVTGYLNGQSFGTISSAGLLFADTDGIGLGDGNSQSRYDNGTSLAASFDGSIAEFIYCNEPGSFTTATRNQIESYLALKYGITLDQSTAINYVNSQGSTIFNTTDNASIGGYLEYNNDIAGIGRDDESEFLQTRSQSENVGSIVEVNRSSADGIGTDDTWLIWGNDAGSVVPNRTESKPDTINERLPRVWRVAEENSMGITDISFDLTGLGLGTTSGDFSLLIADNSSGADFTNATVVTGGTFNGDVITFDDIDLSDGQYFTLGTQFFICTPGNVQDGLSLWLKADTETFNTGTTPATNGQTVETWGDQSRNDFDATILNSTGPDNRAATWVENDVNFNPGLNWNAGTDEIGYTLEGNYIFGVTSDGGMHLFSSVQPENTLTGGDRNNKWVINFGNNNNDAYGIAAYGSRANIVAQGKTNFNISPGSTSFLIEGDINTNETVATDDFKNFHLNGERVSNTTGTDIELENTGSGVDESDVHASNAGPVSIGRQSETNNLGNNSGRRFFGDMQEVIIYNQDLTALEAHQVRSYLAIKYGATLSNDYNGGTANETISGSVVEGDYVASDGSTITFDYSDDTGFVTNIAGIGRDDDTCLEQRQSRSVNDGAILTVGLGEIAATNALNPNNFDDDLDYFTWGSDGASTAFGSITTLGTPGTVNERMLRIWRAQDNGNVGATDISFDLTGLTGYSTNAGDYQLIIASGGDNTSLDAGTTITGGTFNGTILTFDNVDLTDGQYFTLGVSSELCAPGGVDTNMVLWLRADAGTSTTTDNTTLATWTDQSTATNDASADGNPPLFRDNTTDNINYLPTIEFDGINHRLSVGDLNEIKSVTGTGRYSLFGIGIRKDANDNYLIGSTGGTNNEELYFGYTGANTTAIIDHESNSVSLTGLNAFNSPAQTPFLLHGEYDGTGRIIEELRESGFSRNTDSNTTDISGTQTNYIGDVANTGNYNGLISEVLVYNGAITDLEKLRIYSYFGIKYGVTLPQDNNNNTSLNETIGAGSVQEGDLVASDGTTIIWNENDGYASYHNGMAGIGRDDDACLNQKQSTSADDGTVLAIGLGSVATDNAANSGIHDNLDFLVWGHDDGSTLQSSAETSDVPSTVSERMTRIWRVEDTGNIGNTEIEFDLTGLGYGSDASDFRLLIASTGSGGTMTGATVVPGGTFDGNVLSFSGIDLADGEYFTLGTALTTCGPGGVNTNIGLWLRTDLEIFSDAGVTAAIDNDDVLQWNDQSSPAANASEANGGGGSTVPPVFENDAATQINYNPTLFISDQNTTNNSYMETASNTVSGDMTLISVFETAQNQGANNDMINTPSLISGISNSSNNDYGLGLYQGELVFNATTDNSFTARSTTTYRNGEPYIGTGTRVAAASGAVELYINSENVGSGTSSTTALNSATTWAIGNHSDYDNQGQFQGNISEVLVFSSVLTSDELSRVESYLALKYGITRNASDDLGTGGIDERDYRAGDSDVIWDYDGRSATFYNDIAGVGRDDLSCFNQIHSKSENDDAIVDIEISSFPDNDAFLVWGNDNAAIEAINNSERPVGINSRLNREWQAQETGNVGTVSVTFDLFDITGTPLGDNNLNLVRMMVSTDDDFSSGVTLVSPTSIDAVNKTVTFDYDFNGTEGFYYTLGSTENDALPVELISFEAKSESNFVRLIWSTASETNNSHFTVERSTDGLSYEPIAFLEGAATTSDINFYEFKDFEPINGFSYYRVAQQDFSGELTRTKTISVFRESKAPIRLKIFPNPLNAGETLKLNLELPKDTNEAVIAIFSSSGQLMESETISPKEQHHTINTSLWSSGIYFIRLIVNNEKSITKKLIVK